MVQQAGPSAIATRPSRPVVLLDSFHAHNFIDRGLIPGEHTYHRFTGLRRAVGMLTDRQVELRELLVGPITAEKLRDVQLIVLNLPSMDRPPWLTSEIDAVEQFVRGGGGMIFITDHSNCYYHQYHLLPLWQRLGLIPTFETACDETERNKLIKQGQGWLLIRDFTSHPVTEGVQFVATQTGGHVVGDGIVARTSANAWADEGLSPLYGEGSPGLTGDLHLGPSEEKRTLGIVLARSIERGRVVVISDQNAIGDALISYADNWRLWLNACNWAGQLDLNVAPLSIEQLAMQTPTESDDRAGPPTPFDELIASEPDRNAQPLLPTGSWQIECWEPLMKGPIHWGGTDADQFYYFWCWLNRWCWTSAHQQPSNPAPRGRMMLMACESDLGDSAFQERVGQVLRQRGKIVLLADESAISSTTGSREAASMRRKLVAALPVDVRQVLAGDGVWEDKPLLHLQFAADGACVVVVFERHLLQNASFTAPEISPSAVQTKWQRQLYHWLFEQP